MVLLIFPGINNAAMNVSMHNGFLHSALLPQTRHISHGSKGQR